MRIALFLLCLPVAAAAADDFKLNRLEYFERPGINVMYGQDYYPEGHQGGLSIIMHDERIASNGDVRLEPSPGQWSPIPKPGKREVNAATQEIRVALEYPDPARDRKGFNPIEYPDLKLAYAVRARPEGESIRVSIDFSAPIPKAWVGKVGFNLELFPGLLFGKSYQLGKSDGVFQQQPSGPGETPLLARGKVLEVAPETELYHLSITSVRGGELQLLDGRGNHNNGWFVVRSLVPAGATRNAIEWLVTPYAKAGWLRTPVIQVSQVGYHPKQPKQVLIELDPRDTDRENVILQRIGSLGQVKTVISRKPLEWGRFLRYEYARLDFSEVTEPGVYIVKYGEQRSNPFRINANVFAREVWQPTLEYFLPAQMCHMKVMEKYRLWHGACHLDDARMAPVDHNHFDGYVQGSSTLTNYQSGQPVPGLNRGGWHDAGDWDMRVESQADTIYGLALAWELFHVDYDNTSIDQQNLITEIHQPDGKPDVLQQLEHGVLSVVGGYESLGRLYRGIIEPTLRQYVFLGDGASMTDNVVFDPAKTPEESAPKVGLPGSPDDRWVFTEENPRRELLTAAALAAASRSLRGYNDALAERSLNTAIALYERAKPESRFDRVGAAAELLLATKNPKYRLFLIEQRDAIATNIDKVGWVIGRTLTPVKNADYSKAIRAGVAAYRIKIDALARETPYGVPYKPDIWGAGWLVQRFGWDQWMLHLSFPDLFPRTYALQALSFILGVHPGSNTASFVSGVGANSLTTAYGFNRADWSHIPGGSASGTALIRPDFPELKRWPYFWQQTEYVLGHGTMDYLLLVLAADHVLNQ
ncbi:MAG TPA: glycoside hydrolase family 9 protein [Steroidobacteraceae bacterium]|nr:glycoside hydrolase family 9 protein [Steroidobacteraceae bacterium]